MDIDLVLALAALQVGGQMLDEAAVIVELLANTVAAPAGVIQLLLLARQENIQDPAHPAVLRARLVAGAMQESRLPRAAQPALEDTTALPGLVQATDSVANVVATATIAQPVLVLVEALQVATMHHHQEMLLRHKCDAKRDITAAVVAALLATLGDSLLREPAHAATVHWEKQQTEMLSLVVTSSYALLVTIPPILLTPYLPRHLQCFPHRHHLRHRHHHHHHIFHQ